MDNNKIDFLVISFGFIIYGLYCILLSKDKFKKQTVKAKVKKIFFIFGIFSMSIGFMIFLFFIIITFG